MPLEIKAWVLDPPGKTLKYEWSMYVHRISPSHRIPPPTSTTHHRIEIPHSLCNLVHLLLTPHRFTFSTKFADFEHECDSECEGTHELDLEDPL